VHPHLEHP